MGRSKVYSRETCKPHRLRAKEKLQTYDLYFALLEDYLCDIHPSFMNHLVTISALYFNEIIGD